MIVREIQCNVSESHYNNSVALLVTSGWYQFVFIIYMAVVIVRSGYRSEICILHCGFYFKFF